MTATSHRRMSGDTTKKANVPTAAPSSTATKAPVKPKRKATTKAKAATKKKNDPDRPVSALNAYNFFFKYQRAALLHSDDPKNAGTAPPTPRQYYGGTHALHPHLKDKVDKKNRQHRKTHGKIGFTDLVKLVSGRWQKLPPGEKSFFQKLAERDGARYRREMYELFQRRMKERKAVLEAKRGETTSGVRSAGRGGGSSIVDASGTVFSGSSGTNWSNADGCLPIVPELSHKRHRRNEGCHEPAAFSSSVASAAPSSRRTSLPTEQRELNGVDHALEPLAFSTSRAVAPPAPSRRASLPTEVPPPQAIFQTRTPSPFDEQTLSDFRAVTTATVLPLLFPFPAATTVPGDDQTAASTTTGAAVSVATSATATSAPASFPSGMQTQIRGGIGGFVLAGTGAFPNDDTKTASNITAAVVSVTTASTTCASLPCDLLDTNDDYASIADGSASLSEEEFYRQQLRRTTKELEALKERSQKSAIVDNMVSRTTKHPSSSRQQAPRARSPRPPPACHPPRAEAQATATTYSPSPIIHKDQEEGRSIPPLPHASGAAEAAVAQPAAFSSLASAVAPPLAAFDEEETDFLGTCRWDKWA